jgi:MATE family multidrug resistance protein
MGGDQAGMARAGWTAYAMGVGFMVVTASLMLFAPG